MSRFWRGICSSKNRLDGKVALVTGSNTGIGKYTARDFYLRGAHVIMACRNLEKGREAVRWIQGDNKENKNIGVLELSELDLSSFGSVRKFAERVKRDHSELHILVNNAGVMMCPYELSQDGYEMHLATNHLGHFLLTLLLLPVLLSSAPARIVNVSSVLHQFASSMNFEDFNMEKNYSPFKAYARSKLANILFTTHLAFILKGRGVTTYSLHPGVINTELTRHFDGFFSGCRRFYHMFNLFMKTPEQGAQTTIYCAVDDQTIQQTGLYYADCKIVTPSRAARDEELAKELWNKSIQVVGLQHEIDSLLPKI